MRGGGSQWNQAGTYEEKGMTKWLEDRWDAQRQRIRSKTLHRR